MKTIFSIILFFVPSFTCFSIDSVSRHTSIQANELSKASFKSTRIIKTKNTLEITKVVFDGGEGLNNDPFIREEILKNYNGLFDTRDAKNKKIIITYKNNGEDPVRISSVAINSNKYWTIENECPDIVIPGEACQVYIIPNVQAINDWLDQNTNRWGDMSEFSFRWPYFNNDPSFNPWGREGFNGQGALTPRLKPYIDNGEFSINTMFLNDVYYDGKSCPIPRRNRKTKRIIYDVVLNNLVPWNNNDNVKIQINRDAIFFNSYITVDNNNVVCNIPNQNTNIIECTFKKNDISNFRITETNDEMLSTLLKSPYIKINGAKIIGDTRQPFVKIIKSSPQEIGDADIGPTYGSLIITHPNDPIPEYCGISNNGVKPIAGNKCKKFKFTETKPQSGNITAIKKLNGTYWVSSKNSLRYYANILFALKNPVTNKTDIYGCISFDSQHLHQPENSCRYIGSLGSITDEISYISDPRTINNTLHFYLAKRFMGYAKEPQYIFELKFTNGIMNIVNKIQLHWDSFLGSLWVHGAHRIYPMRLSNEDFLLIYAPIFKRLWQQTSNHAILCKIKNDNDTHCSDYSPGKPSFLKDDAYAVFNLNSITWNAFDKKRSNNGIYCGATYHGFRFDNISSDKLYECPPEEISNIQQYNDDKFNNGIVAALNGKKLIFMKPGENSTGITTYEKSINNYEVDFFKGIKPGYLLNSKLEG